jgi:N-acetylgalactosamine-N,N'-diacetylbacillosaminyl-diphospho-undecaprenol 4-alpha-N-acetylgalactosaminyltransferase
MKKIFNFDCSMHVIYNPIDIKAINKLSTGTVDDFIFHNEKIYIISVGRLIDLKRNSDLVYVLHRLHKDVEVIFLGDGANKADLIQLSAKLKILHRVHFLGWRPNPYKIISKCDILISTSSSESFGNVVIESMACSVPVISTRCGGPEEIISDGKDGILVDIGDIGGLVKGVNHLLSSKMVTKMYIENGIKKCNSFEVSTILESYKSILNI